MSYSILMAVRHWPDIAERAVKSIRQFTDAEILLVDDASPREESVAGFRAIEKQYKNIHGMRMGQRYQHGLCLDSALAWAETDWVFTADHDVIVHDERAFSDLLFLTAEDVGAIGATQNNGMSKMFGSYIHPYWALWNAKAILKHNLSFAAFALKTKDATQVFATAQFLSYRLASIKDRHWEAPDHPYKLQAVNIPQHIVEHAQVWQERGETWKQEVKLD